MGKQVRRHINPGYTGAELRQPAHQCAFATRHIAYVFTFYFANQFKHRVDRQVKHGLRHG